MFVQMKCGGNLVGGVIGIRIGKKKVVLLNGELYLIGIGV